MTDMVLFEPLQHTNDLRLCYHECPYTHEQVQVKVDVAGNVRFCLLNHCGCKFAGYGDCLLKRAEAVV